MKADERDRTFDVLRELPVEVSIEQVGGMVATFTLAPAATSWLTQFFNLNSILMTSAGATIIAGSIYLLSPGDPAPRNERAEVPAPSKVELVATPPAEVTTTTQPAPELGATAPIKEEEAAAALPMDPLVPEEPITPAIPLPMIPVQLGIPPSAPPLAAYDGMIRVKVGGKDFNLTGFTGITVVGGMDVIVQQKDFSVTAEGDIAILGMLDLHVKDRTLVITLKDNEGKWTCTTEKPATVFVSMPTLEKVQLTGSGDVKIDRFTSTGNMDVDLQGSGDIDFSGLKVTGDLAIDLDGSGDVVGEKVQVSGKTKISVAGSGDVHIAGSSEAVKAHVVGSGDVEAGALKAHECEANITGSGSVNLNCSGSMNSRVTGSGSVNNSGSAGGGKGEGGDSN